jgi:hypothetical protein
MFFNCFHRACFPSGLYWPDIFLQMHDLLSKGGFHDVVQVHPVAGTGAAGSIGHQGGGVLALGSDGGYINGVAIFALQCLMFFAVDNDLPTTVPPQLLQDLACVHVRYTQHASMTLRSVSILRDTATKCALNRPLDPFMLAGVVEQLGGSGAAHLNDIIKRYNQHFSGQPKLQLSGKTAMRIKSLLNPQCRP